MDMRKLRYFAAVAELKSFTRAATFLGVAQPAISRHIQQLEEELGIELLLREGRQTTLTDAGTVLLSHARTIERDFERLVEDMKARKGMPTGRVIVGMPPTLAGTLVPRIVERVHREYPMIALRISEGLTPVLIEWVENNLVDFAVISRGIVPEEDERFGLKIRHLTYEDMVVIERSDKSGQSGAYSMASLKRKPMVLSDMHAEIIRRNLGQLDLEFNVIVEIDAVQAVRILVLEGKAAAILPVSAMSEELRNEEVRGRAITANGVRRELALAVPRFRQMTRAAEAVDMLVREEIDSLEQEGVFSLDRLSKSVPGTA